MKIAEIIEEVERIVEPIVADEGIGLVDVDLKKQNRELVLTIYLDRVGGNVDLDTIAALSEEIGRHLDVAGLIDASYRLEIASPGLERVLRKPREFRWFEGRKLELKLKHPLDGRTAFIGVLHNADDKTFRLKVEGGELTFPYEEVKRAKLVLE